MDRSVEGGIRRKQAVRRMLLGDEVTRILRQAILRGELRGGEHIRQDEWASRLEVSRMPIREALARLVSEGLVVMTRGSEAQVARISRQDMQDSYLLNATVAGFIAERAAVNRTAEDLQLLQAIQDAMEAAVEQGRIELASEHNQEFHKAVNRASRAAVLDRVLRNLARTIPHFLFDESPAWREKASEDHRALIQALRDGDAETSRRLMEEHVAAASTFAFTLLDERGFWTETGDDAPEKSA